MPILRPQPPGRNSLLLRREGGPVLDPPLFPLVARPEVLLRQRAQGGVRCADEHVGAVLLFLVLILLRRRGRRPGGRLPPFGRRRRGRRRLQASAIGGLLA